MLADRRRPLHSSYLSLVIILYICFSVCTSQPIVPRNKIILCSVLFWHLFFFFFFFFFLESSGLRSSLVLGPTGVLTSKIRSVSADIAMRNRYIYIEIPSLFRSSLVLLVLPASLASKKTFGTQGTRRDELVYPHGFPSLLSHVHRSMVICGINRFILAGSLGSSSPLHVSTNLYIERRSSSAVGEDLAHPGKIPFHIGATLLFSPSSFFFFFFFFFLFEGGNLYSSFVIGPWSYRRSYFEETFGIRGHLNEEQVYLHRDSLALRSSLVLGPTGVLTSRRRSVSADIARRNRFICIEIPWCFVRPWSLVLPAPLLRGDVRYPQTSQGGTGLSASRFPGASFVPGPWSYRSSYIEEDIRYPRNSQGSRDVTHNGGGIPTRIK
ncbi:unnamed protein product [Cuscuta epithymum]|uniref:Uncharacterized protein n=1 Tax=Cuscuta epithymum TaxID=186058 RepID=A0AAV0G3F4_9ASTE|nr:unnamed protein product [Cuscuta epithymum]CAH9142367.1 unnamed protein product [Cuscuta epithymum]